MAEAGESEAPTGGSSQDIRARAVLRLTETVVFGGPAKRRVAPSTDSARSELLDDDAARAVLERQLPGFGADSPLGLALVQLAGFAPAQVPGGHRAPSPPMLDASGGDEPGSDATGEERERAGGPVGRAAPRRPRAGRYALALFAHLATTNRRTRKPTPG